MECIKRQETSKSVSEVTSNTVNEIVQKLLDVTIKKAKTVIRLELKIHYDW